ncbi:hypothetical protein pb186bvf_011330 [Paramecium bursaria]
MIDSLIKSDERLDVIGLFGTLETISEYIHQRLSIPIAIDKDVKSHLEKGILCYAKYQKDFFISFIGTEEYFKEQFNDESAKITLYRYLKDLCQKIIMLPSKTIIENWQTNGSHHYQEQETVLQEFQIQKLNERSIEFQKIKFELKKDYQVLNDCLYGQDNLRVGFQKIITNDYQEFNYETVKQIFLQILNNKHFEINNYDWGHYNQITLQIIKHRMNECRNEINSIIDQLEKQCKIDIQGQWFNIFRSNLKKNDEVFNVIHTQIFDYLRKNLDLNDMRNISHSHVQNLMQEITNSKQLKQYNQFHDDLNGIFKEYLKRFQKLHNSKNTIQDCFKFLNQNIQLDLNQNNYNQFIDFRLLFNIYEFKVISTNNQQIATIDTTNHDQELCQLKNIPYPEKLQIYYIFQTTNQQQTILILLNQTQNISEYILVDITNKKMTEIMRINGYKGFLFYYNIVKTTLYVFNTKIGISILQYNEARKQIQSEKSINYKNDFDFIEVCYLQYYETFILLGQNNQLYKWQVDKRDICQASIQFNHQNNNRKIQKILSTGNGTYYCLIDQQSIHFINQNNQVVKDLQIRELLNSGPNQKLDINNILLFSDESDWYLLIIQNLQQTTIQIKNLSNLQRIVSKKQNTTEKEKTNPFMDLIKGASIKYGPCNNIFKTTPTKTQLFIENNKHEKIQQYFDLLDLDFCEELVKSDSNQFIQGFPVVSKDLVYQMLSRQTVQLCTISNQLLKPLSKGILQEEYQKNKLNQIRILDKVNNLSFGVLENLLFEEEDNNIFIVSIMGRQSSGKSYLLNRIFGTRFGVSSARCTDGIWMSISKIENITFVLLDCEGLFSTRRTQDEETMLLAFLSSISDITILNQDLTFSRNLNELFQNLSKSIEQIRGDKLFKGKLMIAVRDVNQKEKDSAQKELIKNIDLVKNKQQTRNFLTLLFNDSFQTILMSYFDNKQFDKDILLLRREFLQGAKNINRWDNTQQLIRAMKIMLIQIELKDHRSLEDHESEFIYKNINQKVTDAWIYHNQEPLPNLNLIESQRAFDNLQQYYLLQTKKDNSTLNHNERLKEIENHIQGFLTQRMCIILIQLEQDIKQHKLNKDNRVEQFKSEIKQTIQSSISQYMFCNEKCSKCYLQCGLRKDHLEKDQIVQKNNLQEIITNLSNKINELQGQIPKDFNLESTQANLPSIKTKKQDLQNQVEYEEIMLDYQTQIQSLKCQLEVENDFQIDNFDNYLKNYLQLKLNSIEQQTISFNNQQQPQQLNELIDQVEQQILEQNKQLENLSQQANQISIQINQLNNTCLQVEIEKNQQAINNEMQTGQQNEVILQQFIQENMINTNNLNIYNQQYQQLFTKLQNQDIKQLYQQSLEFQGQLVQNLKVIQNDISTKLDKIRNDIRNQAIDNYLEREIEQQEELLQKIQSSYQFKKQKQQVRIQKQQEIQYRLSDHSIADEEQNKLKIMQQQNEKEIHLFTQQLNELEDQKKQQEITLSQLQEIYQQCSMAQFNQNQDILINQVSDQILRIQNQDQLSQQENAQIELANIQSRIQEIQIYEEFLKQQQLYAQQQEQIQTLQQTQTQLRNKIQFYLNQGNELSKQQIQISQTGQNLQQEQNHLNSQINKIIQSKNNNLENQQKLQIIKQNVQNIVQQYKVIKDEQEQIQKLKNIINQKYKNKKLEELQSMHEITSQQINKQEQLINLSLQNIQLRKELSDSEQQLKYVEKHLIDQHTCGRENHLCDQICSGCNSNDIKCQQQAGHSKEIQNHLCQNNNHYCKQKCQVKNCDGECQLEFNHPKEVNHLCNEQHDCEEYCQFCPKKRCRQSSLNNHKIHQCEQIQCTKPCFFNQNYFNEDKKCINLCNKPHNEIHEHHICSNQAHQCYNQCEQQGICKIGTYSEIIKEWTTQNGSKFPYKIYKQNSERIQCQQKIECQKIHHNGTHYCNEKHICDQRCPECQAFCTLKIGHQGKHQPHLHRNKEQQIFTALEGSGQNKLQIKEAGQKREYLVGESCEPETCSISCARRSRAHFHLIECYGGKYCAALKLKNAARHQQTKYKGSSKYYDEILCEYYWNYLGWEHPVDNQQQLNEISLCNFYCNNCDQNDKQFCNLEAWHSNSNKYRDHNFSCADSHKTIGLDICFIIDTTSSMGPYIELVKDIIRKLMKSTKRYINKQGNETLQFSVVSYKDHTDKDVVKSIDFTKHERAVVFLNNLKASGGQDIPEAMFDGLWEALNMSWRDQSKRFMFLVADSPPHGNPLFHNYEDDYPDGCPCGLDENHILNAIKQMKIDFIVLKLNSQLDQTISVFQQIMENITVLEEAVSRTQFIDQIDRLICSELKIREITLSKNLNQQSNKIKQPYRLIREKTPLIIASFDRIMIKKYISQEINEFEIFSSIQQSLGNDHKIRSHCSKLQKQILQRNIYQN